MSDVSVKIDPKTKLTHICGLALKEKNLLGDAQVMERFKLEFKELNVLMEHEYILNLYFKKKKFPRNQNNLFISWLLGLCPPANLEEPPIFAQGEYPDIDTDFHPLVRNYLKTVWAPAFFGPDNVCSIGNYTTFGIKSSLIDVARVHGKDRNEILALTTKLGLKDDEGNALDWAGAMRLYPELKEYCDKNPEVAADTQRLLNRNRGMGKHAGGLIISKSPINELVPLVKGSDGLPVSAFVEGLHGTDLGPLGLIKFDFLVITNLLQRGKACKYIKERHGFKNVCGYEGGMDWSDEKSYIRDEKTIATANRADLKCIFQFDSDGIRKLVKLGGVTCFEDLVAYSALYRPGCLRTGMAQKYVDRKRGKESCVIHPFLQPIIGNTYGVMVYQEQIMKLLNVVGDVPAIHCEIIRKAISKKKIEIFGPYQENFLINGQGKLNCTSEEIKSQWDNIQAFSEYGFNKSHSCAYTLLSWQLLYLKCHYPLEYYAAVLSCEKDTDKCKEYKLEAMLHNVKVNPINLNNSRVKFDITNDEIYIGFGNIKGVGEEVAEAIVAGQPYQGFEDFLTRYGTDLKVLKPLVSLGVFGNDRNRLWEYYEYYKDRMKSKIARKARFIKTKEKHIQDANAIVSITEDELYNLPEVSEGDVDNVENQYTLLPGPAKELLTIAKKFRKAVLNDQFKDETPELQVLPYSDFEGSGHVDPDMAEIFSNPTSAERQFYGFAWDHPMEASDDYVGGRTFNDFDDLIESEDICVRMCEVHVVEKPKTLKTKTNKNYYTVIVEDANSRRQLVSFWQEDYDRFKDELEYWENDSRKGHYLKMRLRRPDEGFSRYSFDSPNPRMRWKEIPKEKELDHRIIVMHRPPASEVIHEAVDGEKLEGLIDLNLKVIEI